MIYIWAESTCRAGERYWPKEYETEEDLAERGDVFGVEEDMLLHTANYYRDAARAAGAGRDLFLLRVARTLSEAM